MELFLNLVWLALAATMLGVWVCSSAPAGAGRRHTQGVALGLLALVLFPVISVTDDLQITQNPAEVDCCMRRAHEGVSAPLLHSGPSAPLPSAFAPLLNTDSTAFIAPKERFDDFDSPGLGSIRNRPPPSA